MKDVNISNGIVPLGEFKARASRLLRSLNDDGEPLVITQNGRPTAVVLSPVAFEQMRERQRFFEAVAQGLADVEAGRVVEHDRVRQWLDSWGTPSESERPT